MQLCLQFFSSLPRRPRDDFHRIRIPDDVFEEVRIRCSLLQHVVVVCVYTVGHFDQCMGQTTDFEGGASRWLELGSEKRCGIQSGRDQDRISGVSRRIFSRPIDDFFRQKSYFQIRKVFEKKENRRPWTTKRRLSLGRGK